MARELVIGRSECGVSRHPSILGLVYEVLFVLDAHSNGKRFGRQFEIEPLEQGERISRGMPACEDEA